MLIAYGKLPEATAHFAKAASLMESDWLSAMMLITCYSALREDESARKAAQMTAERAARTIAKNPTNGSALAGGAIALAMSGEKERSREWIRRALVLDPDNLLTRYNLACAQVKYLGEIEEGIETLRPYFEQEKTTARLRHIMADPDLDPIRDDPRFKEMLAAAKKRLGMTEPAENA